MEQVLNGLIVFGLGLFGMVLYAVVKVWKKMFEDRAFKPSKFFGDNKRFWFWGVALHFLVSILTMIVPEAITLLKAIGFAVEESGSTGWILFGITLGSGTNNTKISGNKMLTKKE